MCSSRPASSPRIWSLRLRLLVGQVVVLAVVCVGITAATEMALRRHLVAQLDNQLGGTSYRSVLMYPEKMPRPPWRHETHNYIRSGPGPRFLDAPGQPAGMVAAVVSDGTTVAAGYLTGSGSRAALTSTGRSQLERIAGSRTPLTLDLDGLGRYRVLAAPSRNGHDVIVTGLSMGNVDATMLQMLIIFGIVTVIALVAATTAGIVIIKRALAPLRRVAQTASEVVDLPLDRGEVKLPVRVPEPDANPPPRWGNSGRRSTGCSTTSLPHCRRGRPVKPVCASSLPMPVMNCELPCGDPWLHGIDAADRGRSRGRRTRDEPGGIGDRADNTSRRGPAAAGASGLGAAAGTRTGGHVAACG